MPSYPPSIARVLDELARLPGVGPKTAERYVFWLLRQPGSRLQSMSQSIAHLRDQVVVCQRCFHVDEASPCRYCADSHRDQHTICVVGDAPDLLAIEQAGVYKGIYHVLGGTINAFEGRGPDQLHFRELLERITTEGTSEVILAMNPDIEGETTSLYVKKALEGTTIKITQLARGIPAGGDVTYMDEATLGEAMTHRQDA